MATVADGGIVLSGQRAAIAAMCAIPMRQPHEGAGRVVGFQDLSHEDKEIQQPPLLQGLANRTLSGPLAEGIVPDVRMRRA